MSLAANRGPGADTMVAVRAAPDFDTVGGLMVAVQKNIARLTKEDRDAIAAYLKALPAVQ